ncbi:MAG: hypothetical protein NQU41_06030 [Candidatus Methanosuratincola sp.]|jgi:hypothetical protein|uniref:Prenylated flavin chaperone LpdD-like domain-containing protein n=2 Tax=Candidatus Methanosuratincola (ex Vanwonterghem et al. 2016) TaxID=1915412 RepID=A0A444L617_METS7|nr:hypothetical protein [Candidatus Methanosuratincola sp.]RWX72997.1 MAG: hypothetical protein Metus_0971 [Candidatus Methanosuratincola subterraneus]
MGITASFGKGRYRIFAEAIQAGDGIIVYVGGGERPHIGGFSLSDPPASAVSFSIPLHKDFVVSHQVSEKVSRATGKRCLAVSGIHVENATKEEISMLVNNALACTDILIELMREAGLSSTASTSPTS